MARQIYTTPVPVNRSSETPTFPPLAAGDMGWTGSGVTGPVSATQPLPATQPYALTTTHHHHYPVLPAPHRGGLGCGPLVLLVSALLAVLITGVAVLAPEQMRAALQRTTPQTAQGMTVASLAPKQTATSPTSTTLTLTAVRAQDVLRFTLTNGTSQAAQITPDSWGITSADGTEYQVPDDWTATLAPGAVRVYEVTGAPTGVLTISLTPTGGTAVRTEVPE